MPSRSGLDSSSLLPVPVMIQNNYHSAVDALSKVILIYPDGLRLVTTAPLPTLH